MLQHINTCVCFSVNKCLKKDKEMFGSDGNLNTGFHVIVSLDLDCLFMVCLGKKT